jgi:hypothetical protein
MSKVFFLTTMSCIMTIIYCSFTGGHEIHEIHEIPVALMGQRHSPHSSTNEEPGRVPHPDATIDVQAVQGVLQTGGGRREEGRGKGGIERE